MNFLAHLVLSDESDDAMVGAVLADFTKGSLDELPPGVRRGIRLHRKIDQFTDTHPAVRRAVMRMAVKWGLYASVIMDVLFDHFLARDWDRRFIEPLPAFALRSYGGLGRRFSLMPPDMARFIGHMIDNDVLVSYESREGIGASLARLSGYLTFRMKRTVELAPSVADLYERLAEYEEDFDVFWPDLADHAAKEKIDLLASDPG